MCSSKRAKIHSDSKYFFWDALYLWKFCFDQIIRRRVLENEFVSIISFFHDLACGCHFSPKRTTQKVLDYGMFWNTLFTDAYAYCKSCEKCKKFGSLSKRNEMSLNSILICEILNVWGMDFMGPFPFACGCLYILLAVDYVSKWAEAIPTRTNSAIVVWGFLQSHIFSKFGVPCAIIVTKAHIFTTGW